MAKILSKIPVIDTQPDVAVGVLLPLNNDKKGVFESSYSTQEQAVSNLKNLLLTSKGERRYLPNFGTGIMNLLFDPNTSEIGENLKDEISSAISFWMPYIIINSIDIQQKLDSLGPESEHGLLINLNFQVTNNGANQTIIIDINQSGTIAIL
jgi:phage baseplate assembly protein W